MAERRRLELGSYRVRIGRLAGGFEPWLVRWCLILTQQFENRLVRILQGHRQRSSNEPASL